MNVATLLSESKESLSVPSSTASCMAALKGYVDMFSTATGFLDFVALTMRLAYFHVFILLASASEPSSYSGFDARQLPRIDIVHDMKVLILLLYFMLSIRFQLPMSIALAEAVSTTGLASIKYHVYD